MEQKKKSIERKKKIAHKKKNNDEKKKKSNKSQTAKRIKRNKTSLNITQHNVEEHVTNIMGDIK